MSFGTPEMCVINLRLRDKKPLSQKLIVRCARFREFGTAKVCVIIDIYDTNNIVQKLIPQNLPFS